MLNVQFIRKTMRGLGLTGKDVGDASGVTKEAASNWLKGESMPRPSKLIDLAVLLKLPVEQLLVSVESRPDPVVAAYFSPSWTAFQSDRGHRFSGIVDDRGWRARDFLTGLRLTAFCGPS